MAKVLIITNKRDVTSDFIVKKLKERRVDFYRFNTEDLSQTICVTLDFSENKYILFDKHTNQELDLRQFTSVYYRRPELPVIENNSLDESEVAFLKSELYYTLEGIYEILRDAFWVSPIYAIRKAENKIYQLQVSKSLGFNIPDSSITNRYKSFCDFYDRNNEDCIIKPVKSGLIEKTEGFKMVFTSRLKETFLQEQVEQLPAYLQEHVLKKYDVRVTVVGKKCFATKIHSQDTEEAKIDWRNGKNVPKHTKIVLPKKIERKCIQLLRALKLRFGAIDFILAKDDNFIFLEINPNGQWAWIERQVGYEISNEIVSLLTKKQENVILKFFFGQIRKFFGRVSEKSSDTDHDLTNAAVSKIESDKLLELFNRIVDCYNEEEERRKNIEGKSSLLIGTMSIVVSVITAMYINLAKSKEVNCWMITDMVLLFIPIVCLIRTVWFSIKVFERKTYHIVSAEEYILAYSKPNPYEELIENLSKYIRCNKEVNNRKVDNMHNAQKFFTWAIISIGVFAFFLLLRNLIDFDFMIPYWIGFCRK